MLTWVLNTPLLFEDFSNALFFELFYIIRLLKSVIPIDLFSETR